MERACKATGSPHSTADRDGEALPPSEAYATACCAASLASVHSGESEAGLDGAGADTASARRHARHILSAWLCTSRFHVVSCGS